MRLTDIEAWTLGVVDRAVSGQPVEDDRVELKSEWPNNPHRAARRIAGHANASAGERILWVVGVDEKTGRIPGAQQEEFVDWWRKAAKYFDGVEPDVQVLNVPTDSGATVVAIAISTERVPLVVSNAAGGIPEKEVPWRAGTTIRSAKRSELLRILAATAATPEIILLGGFLSYHLREQNPEWRWYLHLDLYVDLPVGQPVIVPDHQVAVEVRWPDWSVMLDGGLHGAQGRRGPSAGPLGAHATDRPPAFIVRGESQAIFEGPGPATVIAESYLSPHPTASAETAEVAVSFVASRSARENSFMARLVPVGPASHETARWSVSSPLGDIRPRDLATPDKDL